MNNKDFNDTLIEVPDVMFIGGCYRLKWQSKPPAGICGESDHCHLSHFSKLLRKSKPPRKEPYCNSAKDTKTLKDTSFKEC